MKNVRLTMALLLTFGGTAKTLYAQQDTARRPPVQGQAGPGGVAPTPAQNAPDQSSQQQQRPGGYPESGPMAGFAVRGRVVDSTTREAVAYASVSVLKAEDSTMVTGGLVNEDGTYTVDRIPAGNYLLKINFLGYKTAWYPNLVLSAENTSVQVPPIAIASTERSLKTVEVVGERPVFQLGIDRKTFDVSKSTLNPGGTATDVLANVPTVTVDVDGNVSMRNNDNITIYIDGRPSGITGANRAQVLRQIPASSIERIELITSPSARYDAEGTAGIINIILKKNKLEGFNGSVQASVGTNYKYNGAVNLAYRNKLINAYLNYSYRWNRRYHYGETDRTVLDPTTGQAINRTHNRSDGKQYDRTNFIKPGIDFNLPKNNTLGVSGSFNLSNNWQNETNKYLYYAGDATVPGREETRRLTNRRELGRNYDLNLTHVKKYNDKGFEWSSQVNYADYLQDNSFNIGQLGDLALDSAQSGFLNSTYQLNPILFRTRALIAQTDYVRPIDENKRFELGAKTTSRNIDNNQRYYAGTQPGDAAEVLTQHNDFNYRELTNAVYGIWQQKLGDFGYQAGVRVEQTFITGRFQPVDSLTGADQEDRVTNQSYLKIVPTINLSYHLNDANEFQLSYAKRLNRPNPRDLNPFTDYSDPISLRFGNPYLRPEIIHAFEANWQVNKGPFSITTTAFYRYTDSVSTRIIQTGTDARARVFPQNLGTRHDEGVEVVGRWQILRGWSVTGNASVFASKLNVPAEAQVGSTRSNINYSYRILTNAQIRRGTNIQGTAWYRSPFLLPQGQSIPMYSVDLAVSQDFWQQKATLSLAVNDVFNTMQFGIRTSDDTFVQSGFRKRETRVATLTFSYRFGSLDNLSRRNARNNRGGGGEGGGGNDFQF